MRVLKLKLKKRFNRYVRIVALEAKQNLTIALVLSEGVDVDYIKGKIEQVLKLIESQDLKAENEN